MKDYKWIEFCQVEFAGRITQVWNVVAKEGQNILGEIKWFGRWRCYAFFPKASTVYEKDCLWDIADFVAARTQEHRDSIRARKRDPSPEVAGPVASREQEK